MPVKFYLERQLENLFTKAIKHFGRFWSGWEIKCALRLAGDRCTRVLARGCAGSELGPDTIQSRYVVQMAPMCCRYWNIWRLLSFSSDFYVTVRILSAIKDFQLDYIAFGTLCSPFKNKFDEKLLNLILLSYKINLDRGRGFRLWLTADSFSIPPNSSLGMNSHALLHSCIL